MTLFKMRDETAWPSIPVNYHHTLTLVQHPRGEPAGLSEQHANERKDRGRDSEPQEDNERRTAL